MKKNELNFKIENDSVLSEELKNKYPRRFYRHLKYIDAKFYRNNEELKLYSKVFVGDDIKIIYEELEKEISWPKASKIPEIVFENEHYLIVNKEPNLLTIPTKANPMSLYQQLILYLGEKDIHILNRLDKETSGLVVVAKDRYSTSLLEPTHQHMIRKYICEVEGHLEGEGTIKNYIVKDDSSNKRYQNNEGIGQVAISHYMVIENYDETTIVEFVLETGRTHQIRVHTSGIGHPIVGDKLYGSKIEGNLHLTSYYVEFIDPYDKILISKKIESMW